MSQQAIFDRAKRDAQTLSGEPQIEENMNTQDAAEYIMNQFTQQRVSAPPPAEVRQHPQTRLDISNDFDDFDRSMSTSLSLKHDAGSRE